MISDHFSGKRLEKLQNMQNRPFQVISDHLGGKRLGSSEMCQIGHSESFQTTLVGKIGKVVKHAKLAIASDFGPLWWERLEKL